MYLSFHDAHDNEAIFIFQHLTENALATGDSPKLLLPCREFDIAQLVLGSHIEQPCNRRGGRGPIRVKRTCF